MTPGKRSTGPSAASLWTRAALLLTVLVTAALVQDRDAAKPLLWKLRRAFPHIRLAWAGGGGGGKFVAWAKTAIRLTLEIVRMPDDLHTFNVLRRRWVAERTLWWITRHRRTVRDCQRSGGPPRILRLLVNDRRDGPLRRPPAVGRCSGMLCSA